MLCNRLFYIKVCLHFEQLNGPGAEVFMSLHRGQEVHQSTISIHGEVRITCRNRLILQVAKALFFNFQQQVCNIFFQRAMT